MKPHRARRVSALATALVLAGFASASAQIVDGCRSTSSTFFGSIAACPAGDGGTLSGAATIYVTVRDVTGSPIPNIPAADVWVAGCNFNLVLCGGASSTNADSTTNQLGQTTMSSAIAAGGCDNSVVVVVQGTPFVQYPSCNQNQCLVIEVRSYDIDGDLAVDLPDFTLFAADYNQSPGPPCLDFNYDGDVALQDFTLFAQHYLHSCPY
jgi:hypothetical protein